MECQGSVGLGGRSAQHLHICRRHIQILPRNARDLVVLLCGKWGDLGIVAYEEG